VEPPEPIKVVLRKKEEPPNRLQNFFDLAKIIREHTPDPLSRENNREVSTTTFENRKARSPVVNRRPLKVLFPRWYKKTTESVSNRESETTESNNCYYVDDYCIQHGGNRPCSGRRVS